MLSSGAGLITLMYAVILIPVVIGILFILIKAIKSIGKEKCDNPYKNE